MSVTSQMAIGRGVPIGGSARRPLPAPFTVRDGLLDGVPVEGRLATADDHVPGRRSGQEFRRLVRPAGRCETAIQPVLLRPETTQNRWPAGSVKSLKPVSRSPGTGVAPRASRFLLGPVGIAGADVPVHLLRIGEIGPLRPNPGGYALESQPALAGPEPMPAQLLLVDRLRRVDDVGCLPESAGYPFPRPDLPQLFRQVGDQPAQRRQVKHSRLAAGVRHPSGPGGLGRAACLVSQAAGD